MSDKLPNILVCPLCSEINVKAATADLGELDEVLCEYCGANVLSEAANRELRKEMIVVCKDCAKDNFRDSSGGKDGVRGYAHGGKTISADTLGKPN